MEKWRPVKGYEGLYEVSNIGRVRSVDRKDAAGKRRKGRVLRLVVSRLGYSMAALYSRDGHRKTKTVHRLVYEAFVGEIPNGREINHIDEDKQNNSVSNLEAVTHLENVRHGTGVERHARIISKPVNQYAENGRFLATYPSITEAQNKTGIAGATISRVANGKGRIAGGYIWRFAHEGRT